MYLKCPRQYYYRYIMGIKTPPGVALVRGTSGHKATEANNLVKMDTGEDLPTKEVVEIFADDFSDRSKEVEDWETETKDKVITYVSAGLEDYMSNVAPGLKPTSVEQPFMIDVQGLPIIGFMDVTTTKTVGDYKFVGRTSAYLKKGSVDNSLQLTTYHMATGLRQVGYYAMVKDQQLKTKYHPAEARKIFTTRKKADVAYAEEMYLGVARAVSAGAFPMCAPSNFLCNERFCGYWSRCRGRLAKGQKVKMK
jgi:hypothetical protein